MHRSHTVRWTAALVGCSLLLGATQEETDPEANRMLVPLGGESLLDGVIDPFEWGDARKIELGPEATAWVKHDEEFVYIALRAGGTPITSVQVLEENHVELLHVSAALGAIRYASMDGSWNLTMKPDWRCRATGESPKALEERDAFLREHSWLGTNMHMGSQQDVELKLAKARFAPENQLTLVLSVLDPTADGPVLRWPAAVSDDVVSRPFITGPFPDEASFVTKSWGRWTLSNDLLEDLEDLESAQR